MAYGAKFSCVSVCILLNYAKIVSKIFKISCYKNSLSLRMYGQNLWRYNDHRDIQNYSYEITTQADYGDIQG